LTSLIGLDTFAAASIVDVLSGLAARGCTVIVSVHQCRFELIEQFGNLLLLAKGGRVAYSGKATGLIPHFSSLGYNCPTNCNPFDWAMDLISIDLRDPTVEKESKATVERILGAFASSDLDELPTDDLRGMRKSVTPFKHAFPVLVERAVLNIKRQPNIAIQRIVQVLSLGLIIALFFAPIGREYVDANVNFPGVVRKLIFFMKMLLATQQSLEEILPCRFVFWIGKTDFDVV
jgi:hypothetical protein